MNEKQRARMHYFKTEGREARREDKDEYKDNPYPIGGQDSRYYFWHLGWLLEDDKIRNEKKEEQNG